LAPSGSLQLYIFRGLIVTGLHPFQSLRRGLILAVTSKHFTEEQAIRFLERFVTDEDDLAEPTDTHDPLKLQVNDREALKSVLMKGGFYWGAYGPSQQRVVVVIGPLALICNVIGSEARIEVIRPPRHAMPDGENHFTMKDGVIEHYQGRIPGEPTLRRLLTMRQVCATNM
jgi:hypothetical protein